MKSTLTACFCILFTLSVWAINPVLSTSKSENINRSRKQTKPTASIISDNNSGTSSNRNTSIPGIDNHSPKMGMVNNIVIFVRYADQPELPDTKSYASYLADFNADDGVTPSLKSYFKETSNQMLNINSYIFPNQYEGRVVSWQSLHPRQSSSLADDIIIPALEWLQNTGYLNGINLDMDNNGSVDNITFVFTEANNTFGMGTRDWSFWDTFTLAPDLCGKEVDHYTAISADELKPKVLAKHYLMACGVPNMGNHCDLFELMDFDNTRIPVHMSTYIKSHYMNWCTIPYASADNTFSLQPISSNPFAAYRINSNVPDQYYIVEYRKKEGLYESQIPGSGLIVYRIDTNYVGAEQFLHEVVGGGSWYENFWEQIIYAPNRTEQNPTGDMNRAMFSSLYGRPTFDLYTDPNPDLSDNDYGGLIVTDIGEPGSNISFRLRNSAPKTWKGTYSTNWGDTENWWNGVPILTDDVEIPAETPHSPDVNAWSTCNNLFIYPGATVNISSSNLIVNNNLTVWGSLNLTGSGDVQVVGNLMWESGSVGTAANAVNDIKVQGNMDFKLGCSVAMSSGNIEFFGNGNSLLEIHQPSSIGSLTINKTTPWVFSFGYGSNSLFTINGDFSILNQSRVYGYCTTEIILKGNFTNSATGSFQFYYGVLTLMGNNKSINDQSGSAMNYFNNLRIGQAGNPATILINLNSAIDVYDLEIKSGSFHAQSYTINMRGNWYNTVSEAAFVEGTSRVVFMGMTDQVCSTEIFNTLVINKSMGMLLINLDAGVECAAYQWLNGGYRVNGGSFLVHDLLDAAICGTIIMDYGWIDYTQESWHFIDLKANITINDGTFTVRGGSGPSDWPWGGSASLTMSAGVFDWRDAGIRIGTNSTFTENISGGTIKTGGGFIINRADFTPSGGTVELTGSADAVISCSAGSNFYNLTVAKTQSRFTEQNSGEFYTDKSGQRFQVTRACSVSNSGDIDIKGSILLQSGQFSAFNTIHLVRDWTISGGSFVAGSSTVDFCEGYNQLITGTVSFNILNLNKTSGALQVNDGATAVTCATYTYTGGYMMVMSGSFTANDMSNNGIYGSYYVYDSGTLNLFQDGAQYTDLNGFLTIYGGTVNVSGGTGDSYWPYLASAGLAMFGGVLDFKTAGIHINNMNPAYTLSLIINGGVIRTAGNFLVDRSDFNPTAGTVVMYGPNNASVSCLSGSYFNHLDIDKSGTRNLSSQSNQKSIQLTDRNGQSYRLDRSNSVAATSDLLINGHFGIYAGSFTAPSLLQVKGNWSNNQGAAAFTEGSNIVEFNGSGDQTLYCPSETFYTLKLSKPTGNLKIINNAVVTCSSYDWTSGGINLNTGTFTANDLVQNGIYGSYIVSAGSTLNLYQDTSSYIDLCGFLTNSGGTINVYGGSATSDWSYYADAGLTMSGGTIDFKDHGINLYSGIHALTLNFTGGNIKTSGDFIINRTDIHLNAGYLILYGGTDSFLSIGSSNSIYRLSVNKTTDKSVSLSAQLIINSTLSINSGILKQNGYDIYLKGDFNNFAGAFGFVPGLNTVYLTGSDVVQDINGSTNFYNITDQHTGTSQVNVHDIIHVTNAYTTACDTDIDGHIYIGLLTHTAAGKTLTVLSGGAVDATSYTAGGNVVIDNGSFTASDLVDNGIINNWHLVSGQIDLHQDAAQGIDLSGNITIDDGTMNIWGGNFTAYTNYAGNCSLIMSGGNLCFKDQGLFVQANGAYSFTSDITGGTISVGGNLLVQRSDFHPANTIILTGSSTATISVLAGSYVNNLTINKSSGRDESLPVSPLSEAEQSSPYSQSRSAVASLGNNLLITGSLNITAGQLSAGSYNINVRGDWSDTVSGGGFLAGTSYVYFDGDANAAISTSETFSTLIINKTDATNRTLSISPSASITVNTNLDIIHGMLVMQNYCTLTSNGYFHIASGAGLDPNANTLYFGGSWNDENTSYSATQGFSPKTSIVYANGSTTTAFYTAGSYLNFYDLTIDKGTGQLTTTSPVNIAGNVAVLSGSWADGTESTSYLYGNFSTSDTANLLWASGNTLVFTGTRAQGITYGSSLGYLSNVTINKPISILPGTSQTVTLYGDLNIFGNSGLDVYNGLLATNHHTLRVDGSVSIEGLGKLSLDSGSLLKVGSDKALTVYGMLESIGTSLNPAHITSYSGYYTFNVESGATLSAEYTIFEQTKAYGVEIKDGGLISATHPLSNCTFQNGLSSGTLLTINNSQILTLPGLIFPSNSWGGSYNVKKSANQGSVNFTSALGAFAGPNHEYDPYNKLNWDGFVPDLRYDSYTVSNTSPYAGDSTRVTVTITNNSDVDITSPFYVDFYLNHEGAPSQGQIGDYREQVFYLSHGSSTQVSCRYISPDAGTWHIYVKADGTNTLTETSETNNLSPEITITWQTLPQSITLLSPLGGESWEGTSVHQISWNAQNISVSKIWYSLNNGTSWTQIVSSATPSPYQWTVPNTPSTQCLIKVADATGAVTAVSPASFTIHACLLAITTPARGADLTTGTTCNIAWTYTEVPGHYVYKLEYSLNSGLTWLLIDQAAMNIGLGSPYPWFVPLTAVGDVIIRASASGTEGTIWDDTDIVHIAAPLPPSVPANLTLSVSETTGDVCLSWDTSTGNPTGYFIYRSLDPAFPPARTILRGTNSLGETTFIDAAAAIAGNYFYRVTAYK